jgi:two-component system sensor histidine kinase ResE
MTQRVQDAIQSQRDLVANVSHELKTPLTSIQGFTQAILDGVSLNPEEIHQAAEAIFDESNRMSRLVQDLVTLARLETEMADLHRTPVDISALVRGVTEKFRPQAVKDGVQLNLDVPDLNWLLGDEDRLVQVITNLVDNAIKYTDRQGEVCVKLSKADDDVLVSNIDTGIGIDPARIEEIFEPFHQLDGSSTRRQGGTGLGLALVKKIVEAHNSKIEVFAAPEQGSRFEFCLKLAETG